MKIFVFTLSFLLPTLLQAQDDIEVLMSFMLTEGSVDGKDVTATLLGAEAYMLFYREGDDKTVRLADVWPNYDTFTTGATRNLTQKTIEESEETYAGTLLTFDWHYNDLVNEKAGIAKVNALIFDTPDGVYFSIEITTEDAKKIAYRGHLEGSLEKRFRFETSSEETALSSFERSYTDLIIYDTEKEKQVEAAEETHTFTLNYNAKGDIGHCRSNGTFVLYTTLSSVTQDIDASGASFQRVEAVDDDGIKFLFQLFDDPSLGVRMVYQNLYVQFYNF